MRYKMLQKQSSPRTSLKFPKKFFFFLKEGISCYKNLYRPLEKKKQKNKKTVTKTQRKKFYSNITLYSASAINILDFP